MEEKENCVSLIMAFNTTTTSSFLLLLMSIMLFVACGSQTQQDTKAVSQPVTSAQSPSEGAQQRMIFFGNSLTAGYQLDPADAFPALIADRLDSLGYSYEVVNAGVSGETSSGGLERVDWVISKGVDVFILELGANDGLRGIPTEETRTNLTGIIAKVRAQNPKAKIILAGMLVPPNMGEDYSKAFGSIYPDLAEQLDVALIPFLLEGVAGDPELNLADGIHPTPEGHQLVMETIWQVLKEVIQA